MLENFTYGDTPTREALRNLLKGLLEGRVAGDRFDVSTYELSGRHDIRQLVVSTALTYLELGGLIEATGPFYTTYQWKFLREPEVVLGRFEGERREFLSALFGLAKVGRIWHSVVLDEAARALGGERERIVKALTFLEEKGDLELQVAGVRQGYRVARVAEDLKAVWRELCERFATRERSDLKRSAAVAELLGGEGCLVRRLLAYFGEELGRDCGHCGRCDGEGAVSLERGEDGAGYAVPAEALAELRERHPEALGVGRQVTRFLCGIASPGLVKAKLTRHPLFGSAARVPFARVEAAVEAAG